MYSASGRLAVINPKKAKKIYVFGDLHGDFESFKKAEKLLGYENLLIFLGDYGDRGDKSMEVIGGMQLLLNEHPDRVIALKGNHENYSNNGVPGAYPATLEEEVEAKGGNWYSFFSHMKENFLDRLFLSAIIPNQIFFVHGGISSDLTRESLVSPSSRLEEDMLWSDPYSGLGERPNDRGAGVYFGRDVTEKITKELGVNFIIRSHEPPKALHKPNLMHDGRIVTISSTSIKHYRGDAYVLALPANNLPKTGLECLSLTLYLKNL